MTAPAPTGDGSAEVSPASFRDPSGFVFKRDGVLYRQVNEVYRPHYDRLMGSGLYEALRKRNWLVAHEEVNEPVADGGQAYKILRPAPIEFISYPYEWSFGQLKDAARLTLNIQLLALEHGLTLKDASAYNVQYQAGSPVLIDTLSFEIYEAGRPWAAYRQFCRHFLAPLALMARTDVRLNYLLRTCIDGIPLDLASRLLPRRTRWQPGLALHLHLHARMERASSDQRKRPRAPNVSRSGLIGLLQGLRKLIDKLEWTPAGTEWAEYYRATNYSEPAFAHKQQLVSEYLAAVRPRRVWDLGANTGVFSRVAVGAGASTVAFDVDPASVELNYRQIKQDSEHNLLPLLLDLNNPSPDLGWGGAERESLRARGPVDCAMALALIHHLALANNVPLPWTAAFLSQLCNYLIIEFVPKTDSQAQRLLRSRRDVFDNYDQAHFEAAYSERFAIMRAEPIKETERTLYLLQRRPEC